jgi:hypothetical protein
MMKMGQRKTKMMMRPPKKFEKDLPAAVPGTAPLDREEVIRLLLAEFSYWRDREPDEDGSLIAEFNAGFNMGAIAAITNVIAAVHGRPAKWHSRHYAAVAPVDKVVVQPVAPPNPD